MLRKYWSSTERYLLQFAAHFAYGRVPISLYDSLQYLDDSQVAMLLDAIQIFRGSKRYVANGMAQVPAVTHPTGLSSK